MYTMVSWGGTLSRSVCLLELIVDAYIAVLQAHWDAVSDGPLKEVIDRVKQIADLWLVHAALKPFSA